MAHRLHTGPAHRNVRAKRIDQPTLHAINQVLARTIAYRNVGKDEQADLQAEHLLRLLHSTGVFSASQWRA